MQDRSGISPASRQLLVVVGVVLTTLLLLVAGADLLRPSAPDVAAGPSPSPTSGSSPLAPSGSPGALTTPGPASPAPPIPTVDPRADATLIGAGDIADCTSGGDDATARLLDGIDGTIFTAGDNVYESPSTETLRDCYGPTWGRHLARTRPAAGNHDWQDDGIEAYKAYFGSAATGPEGETWYAYDLGTWRIIVLDSDCGAVKGCDAASTQGQWLAAELADHPAACTLAIFHHPRFSSGEHGDQDAVDPFWRALYGAGVDVVVSGHDHDYERFAPQDPDGREDRVAGIRAFVVGTGGTELRGFRSKVAANSELRAAVTHGLLKFSLRNGSYEWQFIPTEGSFSDRGVANCH